MSEKEPARRDERWSRYPETVLFFAGDPEVVVDLREPVTQPVKRAFQALGLTGPFAVLTAFNPRGVNVDDEENQKRAAELENELRSSRERFVRVDACSPDKSHCECSVAVQTTRERAVDVARRWEQVAIFWWDGAKFWIEGALSEARAVGLPAYQPDAK